MLKERGGNNNMVKMKTPPRCLFSFLWGMGDPIWQEMVQLTVGIIFCCLIT